MKTFGREIGEIVRERLDHHGVGAGGGEELDPARQRRHGGRGARREYRGGVGIERQRDDASIVRGRDLARAMDQRLVADMNAIEVADRDGCARPARDVLMAADDVHHGAESTPDQPSARLHTGGADPQSSPAVAPRIASPGRPANQRREARVSRHRLRGRQPPATPVRSCRCAATGQRQPASPALIATAAHRPRRPHGREPGERGDGNDRAERATDPLRGGRDRQRAHRGSRPRGPQPSEHAVTRERGDHGPAGRDHAGDRNRDRPARARTFTAPPPNARRRPLRATVSPGSSTAAARRARSCAVPASARAATAAPSSPTTYTAAAHPENGVDTGAAHRGEHRARRPRPRHRRRSSWR